MKLKQYPPSVNWIASALILEEAFAEGSLFVTTLVSGTLRLPGMPYEIHGAALYAWAVLTLAASFLIQRELVAWRFGLR